VTLQGSRLWKDAFANQILAKLDSEGVVDLEERNGYATDRRATDKFGTAPTEMAAPLIAARVK
jgi:hypothetical protein